MFIHNSQCPVWAEAGVCTCPREWRIRKNRHPRTAQQAAYPWQVFRRLDDGSYHPAPMMQARTQGKALGLIATLTRVARRFTPQASAGRVRR